MKGNAKIIEHLNQVLRNELTAINQYFLHSKMFKDWGYKKLEEATMDGQTEKNQETFLYHVCICIM